MSVGNEHPSGQLLFSSQLRRTVTSRDDINQISHVCNMLLDAMVLVPFRNSAVHG